MRKTIRCLACLLLLTLWLPPLAHGADSANTWTLVSNRNGIQVYTREGQSGPLKTFRGVTHFRLRDEYAMVALLDDYSAYPDWLHFVDSARELGRTSPRLRELRLTTLLPWPLADREALLECRVSQEPGPNGGRVTVQLINRPHLLAPDPDYIRFPILRGLLQFQRLGHDHQIQVTYQLELDPGGYIPNWLTNILLRDAPYFTLERLRQVVHRPEYQGHYYDFLDLHGPGRPTAPQT